MVLLLNHLVLRYNLQLLLLFPLPGNGVPILLLHRVDISALEFQAHVHYGLNRRVHLFLLFGRVAIIVLNLHLFGLLMLFGITVSDFFHQTRSLEVAKMILGFGALLDMRDVWGKKRCIVFPVFFLVHVPRVVQDELFEGLEGLELLFWRLFWVLVEDLVQRIICRSKFEGFVHRHSECVTHFLGSESIS